MESPLIGKSKEKNMAEAFFFMRKDKSQRFTKRFALTLRSRTGAFLSILLLFLPLAFGLGFGCGKPRAVGEGCDYSSSNCASGLNCVYTCANCYYGSALTNGYVELRLICGNKSISTSCQAPTNLAVSWEGLDASRAFSISGTVCTNTPTSYASPSPSPSPSP
jgi:hypothetical protein